MANIKITDLTNYPVVLSPAADVIPIVDVTNNITKKITVENLFAGRGGGGTGTVTSIGMTVPQGLSVTPNLITTSGTFALNWSGTIPTSSLAPNPTNVSFLRGDGVWAVPSAPAGTGTVTSIGLSMPSAFTVNPPPSSPITTSGTFNVTWNTTNGGKVPVVNLGGTPPSDPTTGFLRADGTWANPVGPNVGTVTSVSLSVPTASGGARQGLTISGSPVTTAGTLALGWDTTTYIPTSSLGSGTANNTTFLRGDGTWAIPALSPSTVAQVTFISTLYALASRGASVIILVGTYTTTDIPVGSTIYFGGDATQGYVVSALSSASGNTTITLTTPLLEDHLVGADVYKLGSARVYSNLILGSYLSSNVNNQVLTVQGVPTTASWLTGAQIPTSSQGTTGQNFYVTANSSIYTKTDYNTWTEQLPFERAIDDRATTVLTNTVGSQQITTVGNGYGITYRLQVTATNLNADVLIDGFKYFNTSGTISSASIRIAAPSGGWTIGYYSNFALAMQLAINALSDALPVTVRSDDANVQVSLVTNIPTIFTTPNPPTVASMNPTSVQPGSFLSSITIPVPASGANPIQPAVAQVANWNWNSSFLSAINSYVTTSIDSYLETQNWYTATITPSYTWTPISTQTDVATGWYWNAQGTNYFLGHAGNVTLLFQVGQIITFSNTDVFGATIYYVRYDGGTGQTYVTVNVSTPPTGLTSSATMYFLTGGNGTYTGSINTLLKWTPNIDTLVNLDYNNQTGVFTNVASARRRYAFSMELGFATTGGAISNQASVWFQLNNTSPGDGASRRGQRDTLYPNGTGVNAYIFTTTWTFSLAPNDTVISVFWSDQSGFLGNPVFGNTSPARLTVVEV